MAKPTRPNKTATAPKPAAGALSDTTGLTQLGSGRVSQPSRTLESFAFNARGRDTLVTLRCSEFTCLCPLTGQPDFATLDISYVPIDRALESKPRTTCGATARPVRFTRT